MTNNYRELINIQVGDVYLKGELIIPEEARSLVIFVHGSGSSRLSPRNKYVAEKLQEAGFGTLLFDLLDEKEDEKYELRFNIELLSERLVEVSKWVKNRQEVEGFKIGYFGASTGAAAALIGSIELKDDVKAIVCRGGRVDLARQVFEKVDAPSLFIVGELDKEIIEYSNEASFAMLCDSEVSVVPGASHLFEEVGKLEEVSHLAIDWFKMYL